MPSPDTIIVQPWFTAMGHPAQSTLNTAKVIGVCKSMAYLISDPRGNELLEKFAVELGHIGPVTRFYVPGTSLRIGTVLGILALLRMRRRNAAIERVLFLDGYLLALVVMWPLTARLLQSVRSVAVICLAGPERLANYPLTYRLVSRFLSRQDVRIFLRTDELAEAWRLAFPDVPTQRIDTLPSLEIPGAGQPVPPRSGDRQYKFGVIGQVRPGKSLEWLVPLFLKNPALGTLAVAGTFSIPEHRIKMPMLEGYPYFANRFLTENEMLEAAAAQDYLVALYDDWDARMEAAIIYVAARVGRPVIVYDRGWCGRVVKTFGCGVAVLQSSRPSEEFFRRLPRPGSDDYRQMQAGILRFRDAHGGASSREVFLSKLRAH